jgi:hypothetical protein
LVTAAAFANGEEVIATIEGEEFPIFQGGCIKADQSDQFQQLLRSIELPPMR